MKKIIFVDGCIKRETKSRTECLAQAYLEKQRVECDCTIASVVLEKLSLKPLDEKSFDARSEAIKKKDFSSPYFDLAKEFSSADEVVIAVPYWDLSFPSMLKVYVEHLCINGLTFYYNEMGIPCGLTNIKKVTFITTAGGYIGENNFGYDYIKGLFSALFSIKDFNFFSAEGLDIYGNNPEQLLAATIDKIKG